MRNSFTFSNFPLSHRVFIFCSEWAIIIGIGCIYRTRTVGGHTHFMTDFSSPSLFRFLLLELQNEILVCFVYRRSHSLNATYVPRMCNFFHWLYLILLDEYRMHCGIELRVRHWRPFFLAEFRAKFHDLMGPRMNAISQSQRPQLTIGWPKYCVQRNAMSAPGKQSTTLCTW